MRRAPARPDSTLAALVALLVLIAAAAAIRIQPRPATALTGEAGPRRYLLEKDDAYRRDAGRLARSGLVVKEDYGAFVLAEAGPALPPESIESRGVRIRRRLDEGLRFRRRKLTREWLRRSGGTGAARPRDVFLVGLSGPVKPRWRGSLRDSGARVLMALPDNGYLVWLDETSRTALTRSGEGLEMLSPLPRLERISPALDALVSPTAVSILFVGGPEGEAAAEAAADRALDAPGPAPDLAGFTARTLTLDPDDVEEISRWPETVWMEPAPRFTWSDEKSTMIGAGLADAGTPAGPNYRSWLRGLGLTDLSSHLVQVVDTGIDTGGLGASHPALAGRLVDAVDATPEGSLEDCVGHGTHIAGIIGGDPPPGFDIKDKDGYELGLGMAPTARFVSSRIFDCNGNGMLARSFSEIYSGAYDQGARISNNSWGAIGSSYSIVAREIDSIVRDVNLEPADGDQSMTLVFAAGNRGPMRYTIDVPGVSKNVITVGASENLRPDGTDGCGITSEEADNPLEVRKGSSRGPTVDGRIKPDILAPGSHIFSAVSQSEQFNGLGVCNTYYPPSQRFYTWTSGTSQATAHVTGGAVLISEWFNRQLGIEPSPALVKAALISSALDLGDRSSSDSQQLDHRPSPDQGWGTMNLEELFATREMVAIDQSHVLDRSGQQFRAGPFQVVDPSRPVSVVLAWLDAPGAPASAAWVNDLDLQVLAAGKTYKGNVLDEGFSVTGGAHEERDNVEAVFFEPGAASSFTVNVTAVSLPGDGVPSRPGMTDQDFALLVTNAVDPGGAGSIRFRQEAFSCNGDASLIVTDAHMAGGGSVRVEIASSREPGPEPLDLPESPPGSGLFRGSIPLSPGAPAPDGMVQAADGDQLVATYADPDDGSGRPLVASHQAVVECAVPVISNLKVERITSDQVVVSWSTDRPARSSLTATGLPPVTSDQLLMEHRLLVPGQLPCSNRRFSVTSTTEAGFSSTYPASGTLGFSTATGLRAELLSEDFESFPSGWTHSGPSDAWELGTPGAPAPGAASGHRAWGTNLTGPYPGDADATLTSPVIDLRGTSSPKLIFNHLIDIPLAGGSGGQDGAWMELSPDAGTTWHVIGPDPAYPAAEGKANPYLPPGSRIFAGTGSGWQEVRVDLTPYQDREVRIRFRLWRDPAGPAPGAGWFIDDLRVTDDLACHRGKVFADRARSGCEGEVKVTVLDTDLDRSPLVSEQIAVTLESGLQNLDLDLTEAGLSSHQFTGTIRFSRTPVPGRLQVDEGETVRISYLDADPGDGVPATSTAEVHFPDCTPPSPPSHPTIRSPAPGVLDLSWIDPADADLDSVRIHYDSDMPGPIYSGDGADQGPSPFRAERGAGIASLSGLPGCTPQFVSLTAVDLSGNESIFSAEVAEAADAAAPCERGRIHFLPVPGAGCDEMVQMEINDGNADPDGSSPGILMATARGSSAPGGLAVTLTETGNATGIFAGTLPLSRAGLPGTLQVNPGDEVEVEYLDVETGAGPASIRAVLPVTDCTAPTASNLRITGLHVDRMTISLETDEPAYAEIEYGTSASLGSVATHPGFMTSHAITVTGLAPCDPLFFRVHLTDPRGNASLFDDQGAPFTTGLGRPYQAHLDTFESGPAGYSHSGLKDEWEHGMLDAASPPHQSDPTRPLSRVWAVDLDDRYERDADIQLISPEIDLTGYDGATLTFQHWYDITASSSNSLEDGGFVQVSPDGGATWTYLTPLEGYTGTVTNNSYIPQGSAVYAGTTPRWEQATFDLDAFAGRSIRIRFVLVADRSPSTSYSPGFGWYLDDLTIQADAACRAARLRVIPEVPDCGDSPITLAVWDQDMDLDPGAADSLQVSVFSSVDPTSIPVTLTETAASSGEFRGVLPVGTIPAPSRLAVSSGGTIQATYDDADDGTGSAKVVTRVATVGDCTPPEITNVSIQRTALDQAVVRWSTSEPASSLVTVLPSGQAVSDGFPRLEHVIFVTGIAPCSATGLIVSSTDLAGNTSVDDNGGILHELEPFRTIRILDEGFETGGPGWTQFGSPEQWEIGPPGSGVPAGQTGSAVAATILDGNYIKSRSGQQNELILESPWLNLSGLTRPNLTFRHYHRFAPNSGRDGGQVEGLLDGRWITLQPAGGYPGEILVGRGGDPVPAYSGDSTFWKSVTVDLTPLGGGLTRVRFRAVLDHGTPAAAPGWYLDDVKVTGLARCRRGLLNADTASSNCSLSTIRLTLADTDLDLAPQGTDTATISASAGSGTVSVGLVETAHTGGLFTGTLSVGPASAGPDLAVVEGDSIEISYQDDDDGTGSGGPVISRIDVGDCTPPALSEVTVRSGAEGRGLVVEWLSSEPATTRAFLAMGDGTVHRFTAGELRTSHMVAFSGLAPCETYMLTVESDDAAGNSATQGPATPGLTGETRRRRVIFADDMEGPDPGWANNGFQNEWERGVPTVGPPSALSGTKVIATDLDGLYQGGTNATLVSPPIDLRNASTATLTFWHYYDIFADGSPNAEDDGAWVEVDSPSLGLVYLEPAEGYTNTIDRDANPPIPPGAGVYAGLTGGYRLEKFDLTPFVGDVIRLRFRIWNDVVEAIFNQQTGFGWYLDDVMVSAEALCFARPVVASVAAAEPLMQGSTSVGVTITGRDFRDPVRLSAGPGLGFSDVSRVDGQRITALLSVGGAAATGGRDLVVTNPDGQSGTLTNALQVRLDPARADLDGSGGVDGRDLAILARAFGRFIGEARYDSRADLNADGVVDGKDLALLGARFGDGLVP